MSMLSAQCDELRDKAKLLRGHADGLKAPYVIPSTKELMALTMLDSAMRMEEAADTIISLRDRLQVSELGSGTCEVECFDDGVDEGMDGELFSYAPPTWYLSCGHTAQGTEKPNFCPVCGAKVVG